MKTAAIICEFNPLHNGHKKIINFAKTFADKVICIMSGNFVQRGTVAVANKYLRAEHAIRAGADLVVELPTGFALSSAENFAYGGVKIASLLNADYLVFGSECGDLEKLKACVTKLQDVDVNAEIRKQLAKGASYPKALALATETDVLDCPNNVLAVEYLRALANTTSKITPVTLLRENNYNGSPQKFASSSALRAEPNLRDKYTYDFVAKDIDDEIEKKYCDFATKFLATSSKEYLEGIAGVTEGLHNRIFNADKTCGYEKMMAEIKTKRYTRAKLQRIIANCVLGITKDVEKRIKTETPLVKVLAVKSTETTLLSNQNISTDNFFDEITSKADRLYATFDGKTPPIKLVKIL